MKNYTQTIERYLNTILVPLLIANLIAIMFTISLIYKNINKDINKIDITKYPIIKEHHLEFKTFNDKNITYYINTKKNLEYFVYDAIKLRKKYNSLVLEIKELQSLK